MEVRRSLHGKAALVISGNNIIKILVMKGNGPQFDYVPLYEFKREYNKILPMTVQDALISFLGVAKRAYRHNSDVITFLWSNIMKNLSEYSLNQLLSEYNKLCDTVGIPHRKSFESKAAAMDAIAKLDDKIKPATSAQVEAETNRSNKMTQVTEGNGEAVEKKPRGKGIGARAKELILEGKSTADVIATIKSEIEGANPTPATIAWYKNKLRQDGLLARTERKAKAPEATEPEEEQASEPEEEAA